MIKSKWEVTLHPFGHKLSDMEPFADRKRIFSDHSRTEIISWINGTWSDLLNLYQHQNLELSQISVTITKITDHD